MRPDPGFTLLVGGARSGKSDLAVQLGQTWPAEVFVAATATAGDDDMADRIARHQAERPDSWGLLEAPLFGANDVVAVDDDALLIVDCITMLVTNLVMGDRPATMIAEHLTMLADALASRSGPSIVVTNEVGMGVHPPTNMGREFRDTLGRANRRLAGRADSTLLVVAGMVLPLDRLEMTWSH
ncbi:MAG: bifunctional adenosylcobinamide kinase/adenosylcobinamide-phosphate guanylyltransferase [Acidimicrobiales bacterium]